MRILVIFFLVAASFTFCNDVQIHENTLPVMRGQINTPHNEQAFNTMLNQFELVVVDFFAEWCGPCKQMHKTVDALAQDSDLNNILFVKINTDQYPEISRRYHVQGLPTIAFFVDGKMIYSIAGYRNKTEMKKIIKQTFKST